jgi:hypothetical protein
VSPYEQEGGVFIAPGVVDVDVADLYIGPTGSPFLRECFLRGFAQFYSSCTNSQ